MTAIVQDELPLDESSATAMGSGSGSCIVKRIVQLKNKTLTSFGSISLSVSFVDILIAELLYVDRGR